MYGSNLYQLDVTYNGLIIFQVSALLVQWLEKNMNGINQEEVSNQSTLENYTLGYCWYPEQEYYSWCPSDLPKKTIHPDPGKFSFFEGLEIFLIRNMEFVKLCPEKELYSWCPSDLPKNTIHSDPGKF